MNDFENKIYQVIASHPEGIKGKDIANALGVEKGAVNSVLSNSNALRAVVKQDSVTYCWSPLAAVSKKTPGAKVKTPVPDQDLQNICKYYLNCLSLETSNSVSQFLTGDFGLQYAVLSDLKLSPSDTAAFELLKKINSTREKKAFLGYPIRIFTIHSKRQQYKKVAPVFMFPIEFSGGEASVSDTPSVNIEALKGYVDNTPEALTVELIKLETELGLNSPEADIDPDELVIRLAEIRQWDWQERIDPYGIPEAADLSQFCDGYYNRPIVIEADREVYTQGLESELMTLAEMPEENYRGTALHAWIKGDTSDASSEKIKPLLEVLPLNSEQSLAVDTSLKSDLTIVTGPPGTGKSQVVTDLLVNIAWNGKSALFSSKNNKAVDVVDLRVNGLSKRPVLLRIGQNQYASRLAEIIEAMLNSQPNASARTDMEFYLTEYNRKYSEVEQLRKKKDEIISSRNNLDEVEQRYCTVRHITDECFDVVEVSDSEKVASAGTELERAFILAKKENNNLFAKLFWKFVEKARLTNRDNAINAYNSYAEKYGLASAEGSMDIDEIHDLSTYSAELSKAIPLAHEYKNALARFKKNKHLEDIDRNLSECKEAMADTASKLWDNWLASQAVSFSPQDRMDMANYVAAMKLAGDVNLSEDDELRKQFREMTGKMTEYLQCWAVTSLSAKSRVPFRPGLFDYVIIDEASQCDIASIIPLLFRAKKAIIIGDPKQLSHISQLSRQQDQSLIHRYNVPPVWSYSVNSLYDLAAGKVKAENIILLKDHFRSCSDIIEFSNEVFYDGYLRTATKYDRLKTPSGEKPGLRWINISGKTVRPPEGGAYNIEEVKAIVSELKRLVQSGYTGTLGVTTPFRRQADEIRKALENNESALYNQLLTKHEFIADTVHKFQGDERDLMIFSTVVSQGNSEKALGFLNSTGNLFNVAITRARAVLVVVGNKSFCANCSVDYLKKFAEYYDGLSAKNRSGASAPELPSAGREYPWVDNPEQVSEWEKDFYSSLYDAGIKTIPQYPVEKYKLDLALLTDSGRKLDIEVDGERYHRSWDGELCYRDQLRNQRMFELGWDVMRFWVYQIRDDRAWCIEQIKKWQNANQ